MTAAKKPGALRTFAIAAITGSLAAYGTTRWLRHREQERQSANPVEPANQLQPVTSPQPATNPQPQPATNPQPQPATHPQPQPATHPQPQRRTAKRVSEGEQVTKALSRALKRLTATRGSFE